MTDQDRKDHELAAKAAGYTLTFKHGSCKGGAYCGAFIERGGEVVAWRPKQDDGDSRRLSVDLRLVVHVWDDGESVCAAKTLPGGQDPSDSSSDWYGSYVGDHSDIYEATRLAVFRCAVEIGRAKQ